MFGLFLQQFAVTAQIEKYVWHLKNVCVVDGQGKTAQKVRIDASYVRDNVKLLYNHVYYRCGRVPIN